MPGDVPAVHSCNYGWKIRGLALIGPTTVSKAYEGLGLVEGYVEGDSGEYHTLIGVGSRKTREIFLVEKLNLRASTFTSVMFLDWRQSGAPDGAIILLDLKQMI